MTGLVVTPRGADAPSSESSALPASCDTSPGSAVSPTGARSAAASRIDAAAERLRTILLTETSSLDGDDYDEFAGMTAAAEGLRTAELLSTMDALGIRSSSGRSAPGGRTRARREGERQLGVLRRAAGRLAGPPSTGGGRSAAPAEGRTESSGAQRAPSGLGCAGPRRSEAEAADRPSLTCGASGPPTSANEARALSPEAAETPGSTHPSKAAAEKATTARGDGSPAEKTKDAEPPSAKEAGATSSTASKARDLYRAFETTVFSKIFDTTATEETKPEASHGTADPDRPGRARGGDGPGDEADVEISAALQEIERARMSLASGDGPGGSVDDDSSTNRRPSAADRQSALPAVGREDAGGADAGPPSGGRSDDADAEARDAALSDGRPGRGSDGRGGAPPERQARQRQGPGKVRGHGESHRPGPREAEQPSSSDDILSALREMERARRSESGDPSALREMERERARRRLASESGDPNRSGDGGNSADRGREPESSPEPPRARPPATPAACKKDARSRLSARGRDHMRRVRPPSDDGGGASRDGGRAGARSDENASREGNGGATAGGRKVVSSGKNPESKKAESKKAGPKKAAPKKADSKKADSKKADSKKATRSQKKPLVEVKQAEGSIEVVRRAASDDEPSDGPTSEANRALEEKGRRAMEKGRIARERALAESEKKAESERRLAEEARRKAELAREEALAKSDREAARERQRLINLRRQMDKEAKMVAEAERKKEKELAALGAERQRKADEERVRQAQEKVEEEARQQKQKEDEEARRQAEQDEAPRKAELAEEEALAESARLAEEEKKAAEQRRIAESVKEIAETELMRQKDKDEKAAQQRQKDEEKAKREKEQDELVEAVMAATKSGRGAFYAVLGLTPEASGADVKKSYKTRCLRLHPDKCRHERAGEAFRALSHAYDTLKCPEGRAEYDKRDAARAAAASPSAAKGTTVSIPAGQCVTIVTNRDRRLEHLNGLNLRGTVQSYSAETGQYTVKVDDCSFNDGLILIDAGSLFQNITVCLRGLMAQKLGVFLVTLDGYLGEGGSYQVSFSDRGRARTAAVRPAHFIVPNGTVVRLEGLESRPDYNMSYGAVMGWTERFDGAGEDTSYYEVHLSGGERVNVKMANVCL